MPASAHQRHRREIAAFAAAVAGDEVTFGHATWREVVATWAASEHDGVRRHAEAVLERLAV